jgi:hypothetical protein
VNESILNPRRSPRLPARCRVTVAHGGAGWVAETEDVGPRGCQIVSPRPLEVGGAARLIIESDRVVAPLTVTGRVAWSTGIGRQRAGVAFAERPGGVDPTVWFKKLLVSQPALEAGLRRVPDRLPAETRLFLRPPPQHIFDFSPDETALIRMLGDGLTVRDVVHAGPLGEARAARAIFALLERRILTLSLGEAAPGWRWKAVLAEMDARPVAQVIGLPPRARDTAAPRPWVPPRLESVVAAVGSAGAHGANPRAVPAAVASHAAHAAPPAAPGGAAPPPDGAVPGRGHPPAAPGATPLDGRAGAAPTPPRRPPEAQACLERAAAAVSSGEISGAIALLRRALALSPRDPEVAALLSQLAFRDRTPPH